MRVEFLKRTRDRLVSNFISFNLTGKADNFIETFSLYSTTCQNYRPVSRFSGNSNARKDFLHQKLLPSKAENEATAMSARNFKIENDLIQVLLLAWPDRAQHKFPLQRKFRPSIVLHFRDKGNN